MKDEYKITHVEGTKAWFVWRFVPRIFRSRWTLLTVARSEAKAKRAMVNVAERVETTTYYDKHEQENLGCW